MSLHSRSTAIAAIVLMAFTITLGFQNCGGGLPDTSTQSSSSTAPASTGEVVNLSGETVVLPTTALSLVLPKTSLNAGEVQVVQASGGTPPYVYSIASGPATMVSSTATMTAGSTSGNAIVRVRDAAGTTLDRTVVIVAAAVTPPVVIPSGSMAFTSPGTYVFTVPNYARLNVDVRGAGGGGGGSNIDAYGGSAGAAGGDSNILGVVGPGGAGGQGSNYYYGVNFYPDGTATPSGNGGGAAGSQGPVYGFTKGQNGGSGGQAAAQFIVGQGGAPGVGTVITLTVGAGGAGGLNGTFGYFGGAAAGGNGAVYISWGP